jgi:hypothetical protein
MTFRITGDLGSAHRQELKYENTTFRILDLFPALGEGWKTPTLLGPLERGNLSRSSD